MYKRQGDYQPTGQGEETLRTLGGIMAMEGQADLYDTPAQQDDTDGTNQGENECGQVVYYSERIAAGCKGSSGNAAGTQYYSGIAGKSKASLFTKRQSIGGFIAVSYTHLDVYKRQVSSPSFCCQRRTLIWHRCFLAVVRIVSVSLSNCSLVSARWTM